MIMGATPPAKAGGQPRGYRKVRDFIFPGYGYREPRFLNIGTVLLL